MTDRTRSAFTLGVLSLLVVVAAFWGWGAATAPLPDSGPPPVCVDTRIRAGQQVTTGQVVVSVYNASGRSGVAGNTMNRLTNRGFVAGSTGNAPSDTDFRGVRIYATERKNPAVRLVRRQFQQARVVEGPALGPGVVVVVGNGPSPLVRNKNRVATLNSAIDTTICTPPDVAGPTDVSD